jgi:serine protease inhibitor
MMRFGRERDRGGGGDGHRSGHRRVHGTLAGQVDHLRLDHPFIFALRDIETGAVLFMGRVVDPTVTG